MLKNIRGFSKLSKEKKINWICENFFNGNKEAEYVLKQYWNNNSMLQKLHDDFSENVVSNYYLPFSIAPNFLINNKTFAVPMAIEESSVVAAACNSAKFWKENGGFSAQIIKKEKNGQIHFFFKGKKVELEKYFSFVKPKLFQKTNSITKNMKKRGGGIKEIKLIDRTNDLKNYYQIFATFDTIDAMGANFINSCLEEFAKVFIESTIDYENINKNDIEIVMSILSNYVPNCIVRAIATCSVDKLNSLHPETKNFTKKIVDAVAIANYDIYRGVTHNKGVMNGIDAVAIATGNDFRAIEAGVHAYVSKSGKYQSLTHAKIQGNKFIYSIEIPLSIGTIGGVTDLHPLVKFALELLGNPNSDDLMMIMASVGLAQNFGALRSLVTSGIQKGHMKMHLINLLNKLNANENEKELAFKHFKKHKINNASVEVFLKNVRK
ncbi:MAG: hydroxymethylglutaryl-CoA reductase, degradative [Bacteroidetes bacterium MED-G13]|nr:MAG: hydroxymethylglutaryl-CoA reductase, degradative [Bacteroidetes bacterium MED-G13]